MRQPVKVGELRLVVGDGVYNCIKSGVTKNSRQWLKIWVDEKSSSPPSGREALAPTS